MSEDQNTIYKEFKEAVNLTPKQLEEWLDSEESKAVGQKSGESAESTGHRSGRRIVKLLRSQRDGLTDDDYAQMRKVVGYVHRHLEQRPDGDVTDTNWRFSLMNWGHDPKK